MGRRNRISEDRHMKKLLAVAVAVLMSLVLMVPAFASTLNSYETQLLAYAGAEFETSDAGVYIKLPADYVTKAENFLNMIDVTEAQFTAAEAYINQMKDLIRTNLKVAADATVLNLSDVTPEFYNNVLEIFKGLATSLDATLTIRDDGTVTDGFTTGTVYIQSNSDPSAVVYIFGSSVTPGAAAVSDYTPLVVILVSLAVVAVVVAAVVITRNNRKAQANA